jgi:hypothetical protein
MASKTFHLNDQPHSVIVGGYTFLFTPEAGGAEFASAYASLSEAQGSSKPDADGNLAAEALVQVSSALRQFVKTFMLPQTVEAFDNAMLPDRILIGMVEFLAEVYAGGNDPGGSSTES